MAASVVCNAGGRDRAGSVRDSTSVWTVVDMVLVVDSAGNSREFFGFLFSDMIPARGVYNDKIPARGVFKGKPD